jgi:hypothetical protein
MPRRCSAGCLTVDGLEDCDRDGSTGAAGVSGDLGARVWRRVRALAWAYPVTAALTLLSGGQGYYTFGLLVFLYAAGCVVTARWAARDGRRWAARD